jgi:deoxyribodipyrimidine photolyase-related protein
MPVDGWRWCWATSSKAGPPPVLPRVPGRALGERACPFTTLYWDFLQRHGDRFSQYPRAGMQWRNLARLAAGTLGHIQAQAERLRGLLTETGSTTREPTP